MLTLVDQTVFQAHLCLVTLVRDFTFVSLSFHICKMGVRIATPPKCRGVGELSMGVCAGSWVPHGGGDGGGGRGVSAGAEPQ